MKCPRQREEAKETTSADILEQPRKTGDVFDLLFELPQFSDSFLRKSL